MSKPKGSWAGRIVGNWKLLRDTETRSYILPDFHYWQLECQTCGEQYGSEFKRIVSFNCPHCTVERQFEEAHRLIEMQRLNKRGLLNQMSLFDNAVNETLKGVGGGSL
jgi:hypothetical protein